MKALKKSLYDLTVSALNERLDETRHQIEETMDDVSEDVKSSAGDKFETAREMARQELEKLRNTYEILRQMHRSLQRIDIDRKSDVVENGALVITDKNRIFVSVSFGRLEMDGESYLLISGNAPLMDELSGRKVGDKINFRGNSFVIKEIL